MSLRQSAAAAATLACLAAAPALRAADEAGHFSVRGAGLLSCKAYAVERASDSPTYLMVAGWVDGYITGVNQYATATYDATSFETTELLMVLLDQHCAEHPGDGVFAVINTLMGRMNDSRLISRSAMEKVRVGEYEAHLYVAVIERVQERLAELGHLQGPVTGRWNEATSSALMGFQAESDLQSTGFPDQKTLWQLLRG